MKTVDEWRKEHPIFLRGGVPAFVIKKVQKDAYDEGYKQAIDDLQNSRGVFISNDAVDKLIYNLQQTQNQKT